MHEWTWHANDENKMYTVVGTKEHAKCRCVVMQWFMQMQCTNMINEKCGNDMSIAMPWRDAWCNQGICQSKFAMCPLIEEPNGNDPKVHF